MTSDLGFKYSILASGSTGNSFYLETPEKKILVDAGLSGKKITSLLAEIDRDPSDLDAILVTHEHKDHIHGVGVLARKYGMDIYANEKTWQIMDSKHMLGKIDNSQKHVFSRDKLLTFIENADGYLIESNHDVEILRAGSYPWSTKQRILSDQGHLCNEDGADAMIRTIGNKTKKIYLGHLSKENNIKELAHMTMENQLARADFGVGTDFKVYDTSPDTATPLTDI